MVLIFYSIIFPFHSQISQHIQISLISNCFVSVAEEERISQSHVANFLADFVPKLHQNASRLKNLEEAFSLLLHFAAQGPEEVEFLLEQNYLTLFFKFYNQNFRKDSSSKTKQERNRMNNKGKFGPFLALISLMITSLPQRAKEDDDIDMTTTSSSRRVSTDAAEEEKSGSSGKDDEKQKELESLSTSSFKDVEKVSYRAKHTLSHMTRLPDKFIQKHMTFFRTLLMEDGRHPNPEAASAIIAHLCCNNPKISDVMLKEIGAVCHELYHSQINFALEVAQQVMLLDDGLREHRIVYFMPRLLKAISHNKHLEQEREVLFTWLARAVKQIPGVCQWLFLHKEDWFNDWVGATHAREKKNNTSKAMNPGQKTYNQLGFLVVLSMREVREPTCSSRGALFICYTAQYACVCVGGGAYL